MYVAISRYVHFGVRRENPQWKGRWFDYLLLTGSCTPSNDRQDSGLLETEKLRRRENSTEQQQYTATAELGHIRLHSLLLRASVESQLTPSG